VSPENSADHPLASAAPESPAVSDANGSHSLINGGQASGINGGHAAGVWAGAESPDDTALNGISVEAAPGATLDGISDTALAEQSRGEPVRGTLSEWVITILLLLFLTSMLVQAFVIPTGSMEDTLLIGDHLLVDKMAYSPSGPVSKYILPYREPKRGDIIVFRYPTDIQQTFVKRCMGVPGDHIRIVNKQVYINGRALDEPYKYNKTDYLEDYRDNFPSEPNVTLEPGAVRMLENNVVNGEVVVPPNSYFAMGDNRDSSWDSRFWGFVPRQNIIGKPLIIYWSYDRPSDQLNTNSISFPQILDLATHFFSKTRWRRTFQLIHGYPVQ
jgi:signal peptidase I